MATLVAESLNKTFAGKDGPVEAVINVNLSVASGDFVALYGPSGCGKSTLLLMLGGLLSPDAGQVTIADTDVYAMSADARAAFRAQRIGFVFQQFYLIPFLGVLDNVLVPTLAAEKESARERALELLELFQLSDRLKHVPSTLSVGEQQRVALARALLHEPQVLFADEPTGNLDPENAEVILTAMQDFATAGGAVIMVTHDPVAKEAASRGVELKKGALV